MIAILLVGALVLFLAGIPMAVALGLSSVVYILLTDISPNIIVQRLFSGVDVAAFIAIPFFILAGNLMLTGGLAHRLIRFANALVGRLTGGLAIVTILACMFFAAISGSAIATVAALGSIMIPAMIKRGYDREFASSVVAVASPLGSIIPPSVGLIIYGTMTSTSIKDLYTAAVPAGIYIGIALGIVAYFMAKRYGYKGDQTPFDIKEVFSSFKGAFWSLGTPIIMVGGVFGGFFTPTESAVVAVAYAILIGLFVHRDLKIKDLVPIFFNSAKMTATIMFIIANAALFSYILTYENIPQQIVEILLGLSENPIVILFIITVTLLIAGMFLDTTAILIIMVPMFLPVVMAIGMDPVVFGVLVIVNTNIGLVTPPYGITLLTAASIGKTGMEKMLPKIALPLLAMIIVLFMMTYFPSTIMFPL